MNDARAKRFGVNELAFIRRLVDEQSGVVLDAGKDYLIESRLDALCRHEGLSDGAQLVRSLQRSADGDLMQRVVEAMMTTESSFFRDDRPFEALRQSVIPALLERADYPLNIWSAACSNGQEPYSIALTLRESFPQLAPQDVQIVATDLSRQVLQRAREGVYSNTEISRGLPSHLQSKHLAPHRDGWQVRADIRQSIEFQQLNLAGQWPWLPRMDIVFLRNVMIYFSDETRSNVLRNVAQLMNPNGYLFLGATESTRNLNTDFESVGIDNTQCYRLIGRSHSQSASATIANTTVSQPTAALHASMAVAGYDKR